LEITGNYFIKLITGAITKCINVLYYSKKKFKLHNAHMHDATNINDIGRTTQLYNHIHM